MGNTTSDADYFVRSTHQLDGLHDDRAIPFPLTRITTESVTVWVSVGELRLLMAEDGYAGGEGDVQLFGIEKIHGRLRTYFESLTTREIGELALDE